MSNQETAIEYVYISWEVWAENSDVWNKCIAFGDDLIMAEFKCKRDAAWYRGDRYMYVSSFEENLQYVSGSGSLPRDYAAAVNLPYFFVGTNLHAHNYPELGFYAAESLS